MRRALALLGLTTLLAALGATTADATPHTNPPLPPDSGGEHSTALQMSVNGAPHGSTATVPLTMSPTGKAGGDPNAPFVIVPGDTATGWVDVRNDGPGDGTLTVTFARVLTDAPDGTTVDTDDFFLDTIIDGTPARDLADGDLITSVPIRQGETVRVEVGFEFPFDAVSGNSLGGVDQAEYAAGHRFVHYDVHLHLAGELPPEPPGGLTVTGSTAPAGLAAAAAMLATTALALTLHARSRARRSR